MEFLLGRYHGIWSIVCTVPLSQIPPQPAQRSWQCTGSSAQEWCEHTQHKQARCTPRTHTSPGKTKVYPTVSTELEACEKREQKKETKMGKKGSGSGVNTKVQAAREKQAAVEGAKAAKARAAEEAAAAKEWSKGSNERGSKRESDAARKQEEKAAKSAAKKALQAEEAEQQAGYKSVVVSGPEAV